MRRNDKFNWFLICNKIFLIISLTFCPFLIACKKKNPQASKISSPPVKNLTVQESSGKPPSISPQPFKSCADNNDINAPEPNWLHPRSKERIQERRQMARHIHDYYRLKDRKVLEAMENVPRHWFVPENMVSLAYNDSALPIGYDQTISQPFIVAYMTSQLNLDKNTKVLEIGTGSGYQAAVLTEFTPHVFTIEIIEPLAKLTAERLKKLGYTTIKTRIGDGYKGWPEEEPFDVIIVTAAPENIPEELVRQLAPGGRMVLPVGQTGEIQSLILITKDANGKTTKKELMPVRFVPMLHSDSESNKKK